MKQKHTGTAIKRTRGDVVFDVINALLLLIVMLVVAYPLVYAISCSFSSPLLVVQSKVYLLPKGLTTIAYERVFNNHQILTGYKNTVFYTLLGTAINIILTTITAYPLSRRDFKARQVHHLPVHLYYAVLRRPDPHVPGSQEFGADEHRVGADSARRNQQLEHVHHEELLSDQHSR